MVYIQHWSCVKKSNINEIQRFLREIVNAPWCSEITTFIETLRPETVADETRRSAVNEKRLQHEKLKV